MKIKRQTDRDIVAKCKGIPNCNLVSYHMMFGLSADIKNYLDKNAVYFKLFALFLSNANLTTKGSPDIRKTVKKGDIVPFRRTPPLNG